MRRRYSRGRQSRMYAGRLTSMAVLLFALSACVTAVGLYQSAIQSPGTEVKLEAVADSAKMWLSNAANRGGNVKRIHSETSLEEKLSSLLACAYPAMELERQEEKNTESLDSADTASKEQNNTKIEEGEYKNSDAKIGRTDEKPGTDSTADQEEEPPVTVVDTQKTQNPVVLIYHTHATESYQPVTEGNFHSLTEEGTVRQVGNELTKALKSKGIPVLHDMTVHDSPSYNQSYSRSIETVKKHLAENPSIKIVIDLHRDAASYSGNAAKTVKIKGETAASYSLVVGQGNANVKQLMAFAGDINRIADSLYPGFGGRIIEKQYRFNQYVCDHDLLLEVGNNENTIAQAKTTGKYFADVIEAYMKTM